MSFNYEKLRYVFEKAALAPNMDEKKYRKDLAGAIIAFEDYSKESNFGWEVDYIYPESKGGSADSLNLRPMHWKNKKEKGNNYPDYRTVITSVINKNIEKVQAFTVNRKLQEELKELYE
ncbi:MAG: HNH endonuclease [Bacteroidia bacterium]|nr:HNH endonuclease [Bacteroidia bacterium]